MDCALMPLALPEGAWRHADVRAALQARDVGAVFRHVQKFTGAGQARLATAVGMTQARVNEIMRGRRVVTALEVFERIADGLEMPDEARQLLGLAARGDGREWGGPGLGASPEVIRVYGSQAVSAPDVRAHAEAASEVDVLAVRGLGLFGLRDSLLRASLRRPSGPGPVVRVLLLHPDTPALARRAAEIGESPESLAGGVRLAEVRLKELAQVCEVSAYRYRAVPTWRLIRMDATMYVSSFAPGQEGHESAVYRVTETPNGLLYQGFRRMFQTMLDDAERVL